MTEQGGSLRVVYFRSPKARRTETNSLEVLGALKAAIPVGSELRRSYRVERTKVRHCDIPKKYAWWLLANSRAELPELYQPKASTKREFYTAEEAPFADAELEDGYRYEGRYTESFASQDEEEQTDLEPSPEQYETSQPLTLKGRSKPGAAKPAAELVRFAQRVLNAAEGERLDDDGDLGRLTRGALERFRKRYGLGTGGVLDGPTELALAQRALEELAQQSIFAQRGMLDAKTKQALAAFKAKRGLGFDSTLDAATRAALADTLTRRMSSSQAFPAPARTGASTSAAPGRASMSAAKRDELIAMALTQATTAGTKEDREAIAATLKANRTDLATWFGGIVPDATFLGRQIRASGGKVPGIHRELLVVLKRAERTLLDKHPGRTAEQLGKGLGLYEIKGIRPPKKASGGKRPSLHCFGLAVDINHDTNPFVGLIKGKPGFEDNRSPRIIERAMRLLHGEKFDVEKPLELDFKLPADAKPELVAGAAWDIHHRASETLAQYLRLDVNGQRVQTLVAADRP